MDPPPFPGGSTSTTVMTTAVPPPPGNNNHALSVDSSPRSRDEQQQHHHHHQCSKLRLMCSYGGYIYPRPHDKCLSYIGGDTRMFVAERNIFLSELTTRLSKTFLGGKKQFSLKYQLQNEDLDSLVSVTSDEDLENMIDEYDRINIKNSSSSKVSTRLRLFLFPSNNKSDHSWSSVKSDEWFVNVLNGGNSTTKLFSESSSVNCLLGLEDDVGNANVKEQVIKGSTHDVLPDSPMVETTSSTSFGSTSSMPALAPIKVHAEEKFSQMTLGGVKQKLEDGGFMAPTAVSGMPVVVGPPQLQPKFAIPSDLPSPDSVSSEGSVTNPLSRQRHYFYQEPGVQIQSMSGGKVSSNSSSVDLKESDSSGRPQVKQQVQDGGGYALPVQHDQHAQMLQPQQYVHYIRQTPSGPVPMASYHPIYPSQHQNFPQHPVLEHQYPVYFIPGGPAQGYSLPLPQTNVTEPAQIVPSTRLETPLHPTMATPAAAYNAARNPPASKPEMVAGTYRTAAAAAPQFVQITSGQHQPQYVAYSQIQHTSQSIPPMSTTTANYAYDFADPTQAKMYYSQPLAPQLTSQYQNMTSFPAETSSQLPFENLKQQIRTSQTRNVSST